jgi:ornithine cyclodeaminase/alanine dehydrogenase-like protein (mu-crystallin family)
VRLLSRADVEAALDLDALVDELAKAFAAISAGTASMPPRIGVDVPGAGTILVMGAHRHESESVTVKLVSLFPGHDPAHQAAIVVIDAATGAHVNSVGYTTAGRELDPALVEAALVVVESRESALAPPPAGSGDLEGAEAHAELGELVAGTRPGRTDAGQLTLYKSVGVALEDDAAARLALRGAEERALGRVLEI